MELRYVLIELSNVLIELSNILKVERFNQFRFEIKNDREHQFSRPEARKGSQQSRRTLRLNQAKSIPNGPP